MTDTARTRILARLKAAPRTAQPPLPPWQPPRYEASQRLDRFAAMLRASHADVHLVTRSDWPQRLHDILKDKGVQTMLYAPQTEQGRHVAELWAKDSQAPRLLPYDCPIEQLKSQLVHETDAALTTAQAGIAETGTLVLWPGPDEPRLMSLLPPIHVALLDQAHIADTLADLMCQQQWASHMPTNLVLVSGPSKTADIEQTLAYGVHGPKELIVLVLGDAD